MELILDEGIVDRILEILQEHGRNTPLHGEAAEVEAIRDIIIDQME